MKEKTKIVYYCGFCKRHGLSKYHMEQHEKRCNENPINDRKCFNCVNLIKGDYGIEGEYNIRMIKIFFCNIRSEYLHTPINEHKGNFLDDTLPMVKIDEECDLYKPFLKEPK